MAEEMGVIQLKCIITKAMKLPNLTTHIFNNSLSPTSVKTDKLGSGGAVNLLALYHRQSAFSYILTAGLYILCGIAAPAFIIVSIIVAFLPSSDFFQKLFCIGLFVMGTILLIVLVLHNPMKAMKHPLADIIRAKIILRAFEKQVEICNREIQKMNDTPGLSDQKQMKFLLLQIQTAGNQAVKALNGEEELLEDL